MDNIKVIVRYEVPGATLMKREDAEKDFKKNHERSVITVTEKVGKNKVEKSTYNVYTRKAYTATEVAKMTDDAYKAMTDKDSKPEWFKSQSDWKKLSKKQRLELHLKKDSESRGALSFSFEILPD